MQIRVASYNVHKGVGTDRARRPDRILDVLREIDADIVALQEADRRFGARVAVIAPDAILGTTDYVPVALAEWPHSLGWHGNALLIRKRNDVAACARIALPTLEPRGAVVADIATAAGPLRIVGMHLDLSGLRRSVQAQAIVRYCADCPPMPTVLMGDLNEWSLHGGCLRAFAAGFAQVPLEPSFHSRRPLARLDRIMVSPHFRVMASGVHRSATARVASDHLPVWADLELTDAHV